jgi:type I restriction enzyme M protein
MVNTTPPTNGTQNSLHERRQRLFELHSFLRSVDNLRSDEALDEIAKLFELWCRFRSFECALSEGDLALSECARTGAIERLAPLLAGLQPGHGADLFQELVDVGVRAGMGQYFTPSPVAEAMAAFLQPVGGETWLDPFCGSGLLLGALVAEVKADLRLFGIDRDPRVLNLARVEGVLHHPFSELRLLLGNALEDPTRLLARVGAPAEGVDGIVANPPFGAEVHEADRAGYSIFELAGKGKTPLEVLGLEQCVRLLRPGGRLGIVLPQSILSNRSLAHVRRFALERCAVDGVLSLPPEAFLPFKGVSKSSVLFLSKQAKGPGVRVRLGVSRSVGWDATGKPQGQSDVAETARAMKMGPGEDRRLGAVAQDAALSRNLTAEWLLRPHVDGRPLNELCSVIFTGRSPGRAAYQDPVVDEHAYRVLKVGDLTNRGVDWSLGERSVARLPRPPTRERLVHVGDLATTAAAHHPRYIGAKVDYIDCLPERFGERCFPVAEVLVLRPRPDEIDPLVLLLWLRSTAGRRAIQSCVTGQTAHLNADDVAEVVVPTELLSADSAEAVAALEESLRLRRLSESAADAAVRSFTARQAA